LPPPVLPPANRPPPKPAVVHAPDTGELSEMRVALTAPLLFVEPNATAHRPTFSALLVTVAVVVMVAPDPIVTVRGAVLALDDAARG
jgi:hypothetical protein